MARVSNRRLGFFAGISLFILGVSALIARFTTAHAASAIDKISPQLQDGLDHPILNDELGPRLNPNFGPFSVAFHSSSEPNTAKLCATLETPRLVGHTIGCGTAEDIAADLNFAATKLYGDTAVTSSYASGKAYSPEDALVNSINRISMFAKRAWDLGSPFTGLVFQDKSTNERVALSNVGINGLDKGPNVVEAAIMVAADHQDKGVGTEVLGGMFFTYLPAVKADNHPTLAGGTFESLAYTTNPGSKVASISEKFGFAKNGTFDGHAPLGKDVYQTSADYLTEVAHNTAEAHAQEVARTIARHKL
jgi:hypothetical protein